MNVENKLRMMPVLKRDLRGTSHLEARWTVDAHLHKEMEHNVDKEDVSQTPAADPNASSSPLGTSEDTGDADLIDSPTYVSERLDSSSAFDLLEDSILTLIGAAKLPKPPEPSIIDPEA